jgi:hypothetical protein
VTGRHIILGFEIFQQTLYPILSINYSSLLWTRGEIFSR